MFRASVVLNDCRHALERLHDEKGEVGWRVQWIGAMALIRAVGHVLDDEAKDDSLLKSVLRQKFKLQASDKAAKAIYWDFIKKERDLLLKEYRTSIYDGTGISLGIDADDGSSNLTEVFVLGENLFRPVLDGYGEGEDARDIYLEAIEWWAVELQDIYMRMNGQF
jgi:hypothetical protein